MAVERGKSSSLSYASAIGRLEGSIQNLTHLWKPPVL